MDETMRETMKQSRESMGKANFGGHDSAAINEEASSSDMNFAELY